MSAMNPIQASHISGDVKAHCNKYMNYHVIAHMKDGSQIEGIIDGMDNEGVTMLVPEEVGGEGRETDPYRQPFGYGYRRFRRQHFPFLLFGFPFFRPFPYYRPFYPYYPWY
ncbi:hypothetical protein PAECIP111891_04406 [Paenibacillus allorhizoplanae]|uniref:Uncharacterized protein n=1 Tax=Paenibacillus allorhizoplanae TaxID=2905648 RepID=A0ABM9CLJ9_9BACL|nr:hypothetical protein [Paenibacillus allorhizoplanae]CAH1216219.1 hypothetical protein PAECIP111891_04406 [Paenibacillus allorhizoplanae]